jgi:outer membrane lipoprotein-sorting protein
MFRLILIRSVVFCLLAAVLILRETPADAYVLPGPQLLDLMTARLGKIETISVAQQLSFVDNRGETSGVSLRETAYYRYPQMFRLDSRTENLHRTLLIIDSETLLVVRNQRVTTSEEVWDRYKDVLFYRSPETLQSRLALFGLDVSISSLGRFEGKPCYVLGAQYPSLDTSQIWINKDSFLPIRWLIPKGGSSQSEKRVEFRYLDWQNRGKLWFPMRIEILEDEKPVREIVVEQLQINPNLDGSLFNMDSLKKKYPVTKPMQSVREPLKPSEDIKKTIDNFKKRYE